jgi:23S rRNA pseudouridine1911/1915/1917 synthase
MSGPDAVEPLLIPAALEGERIDRAVALITGWRRRDVQDLVEQGSVTVDGTPVAKSHRLRGGEVVELLAEPEPEGPPGPDPAVAIVTRYADDDVLVVAKAAGVVTHPAAGHPGGTLVNGLLAAYPELATVGDPLRPGIVHRLDRDTSGLMLVARSAQAYDALVAALAAHAVERRYATLVWGTLDARRGVVDAPIGRSVARRTRMAVRESGRPARTAFEVREEFATPLSSLLECRLETGRTHQIRVHLAAVGHPVVGDRVYGGNRPGITLERMFLHASDLAFDHPLTGVRVALHEPLPDDLAAVLDALRR